MPKLAHWLALTSESNRIMKLDEMRPLIFLHFSLGNKYYEDYDEQPGRHRWVDYAAHDFNVAQLEPVWHSWLHSIRQDPPNKDPIIEASRQTWEIVSIRLAQHT